MTGINKRSNDPKVDQTKLKINPLYNTASIIKAVGDVLEKTIGSKPKKKK